VADEGGRAVWPLVDPSLPAPFNLRQQDFWHLCSRIPGAVGHPNYECNRMRTAGLAWDMPELLPSGVRTAEASVDYSVYVRSGHSSVPRLVGTAVQSWSFGLPAAGCGETAWYSVSAIVGEDRDARTPPIAVE
jgi:hypothetical protein